MDNQRQICKADHISVLFITAVVNELPPPQVSTQHIYPDKPVRDEQTNLQTTTVSIKFQVLNGVHYVQGKLKVRIRTFAICHVNLSMLQRLHCDCFRGHAIQE